MKPYCKPAKSISFTGLYFLLVLNLSAQTTYYVSAKGNNTNDGKTKQTAWNSIEKVNATTLYAGDKILFEAGNIFKGTLLINNSGMRKNPIIITAYGNGKATIDASDKDGIKAINVSNIHINNLIVKGSGVANNKGNGILFYSDDTTNNPQNIFIEKCDVSGFYDQGIAIGCGEKENIKGYKNVRITYCTASENGQAGISSYGSYTGYQNKNFYIAYCKTFNNRGIPGKTENHSGNGIVMGEVDTMIIEHCESYENGADNSCSGGGPVGIWVWMCKNAVIQYCVSHNNHAGVTKDGGGFDIDGGASNCIMQYNYSYNNEGAGYLLAEYGALFPFTNNIIRFNISENDGRKNNYGGIGIWGADSNYKVTNCYVYNNTIYSDDKNIINGTPAAITLMGPHFSNVIITNNIFALRGNTNFINADSGIKQSQLLLLHNNYYSYTNQYSFNYGVTKYTSLEEWKTNNNWQESWDDSSIYIQTDPLFIANNKQYSLQQKSALRKNVFPVFNFVKDAKATTDNCETTLPLNGLIFPGACIK